MLKKDNCIKIVELFFSEYAEDRRFAKDWLSNEIGIESANANFVILLFYRDWESDSKEVLDDNNYFDMKFNTYSTGYGNNYRYEVICSAKVNGKCYNISDTYSRNDVSMGEPKFYFMQWLSKELEKDGFKFDNEIFCQEAIRCIPVVKEEF